MKSKFNISLLLHPPANETSSLQNTHTHTHTHKRTYSLLSQDLGQDSSFILFFNMFTYFNWRLITLQYCVSFAIHYMNPSQVYLCSPSWTPLPLPSPSHPSGSSHWTSPKHPVSCIKPGLVIHFTYHNIHVSMPFSPIIPPSPSPTESKRLFYASVSFLLSHIGSLLPSF